MDLVVSSSGTTNSLSGSIMFLKEFAKLCAISILLESQQKTLKAILRYTEFTFEAFFVCLVKTFGEDDE